MRIDSPQIVGNLSVAEGSEAVLTGSFTGSFTGDGSGLTGVAPIAGTGVDVTGTTVSIGQSVGTSDSVQFNAIGVGTAPSGAVGSILATNDVVAFASSDERLKENIVVIPQALEKIESIGGYEYDWIAGNEEIHINHGHDLGVIAQEVEKVLPELVTTRDNGYLAVKYDKLTAVLIEAVKELSARVKELESK
jgi:hypothetical protein